MSDITKCPGEREGVVCPQRNACHRFRAPDGERQSYMAAPFDHLECEYFWPRPMDETTAYAGEL